MFGFNKNKQTGDKLTLKIDGMHCTSCSLNIDGELEDMEGISEANTNYVKSISEIIYDPKKVSINSIKQAIVKLGYKVNESSE
jgi:copper chaperone CopZ